MKENEVGGCGISLVKQGALLSQNHILIVAIFHAYLALNAAEDNSSLWGVGLEEWEKGESQALDFSWNFKGCEGENTSPWGFSLCKQGGDCY